MKTELNRSNAAFTLIEMIGVLAIIAILAAILVPKIVSAISDSRFSNAVSTINSCKTATMNYFSKNLSFGTNNYDFDNTLVSGNFLESLQAYKLGTGSTIEVTNVAGSGGTAAAAYKLDGSTTITGTTVVEIVITNVAAADAVQLSKLIDGSTMTAATTTVADALGRVVYAAPAAGVTTVYVYLAHY